MDDALIHAFALDWAARWANEIAITDAFVTGFLAAAEDAGFAPGSAPAVTPWAELSEPAVIGAQLATRAAGFKPDTKHLAEARQWFATGLKRLANVTPVTRTGGFRGAVRAFKLVATVPEVTGKLTVTTVTIDRTGAVTGNRVLADSGEPLLTPAFLPGRMPVAIDPTALFEQIAAAFAGGPVAMTTADTGSWTVTLTNTAGLVYTVSGFVNAPDLPPAIRALDLALREALGTTTIALFQAPAELAIDHLEVTVTSEQFPIKIQYELGAAWLKHAQKSPSQRWLEADRDDWEEAPIDAADETPPKPPKLPLTTLPERELVRTETLVVDRTTHTITHELAETGHRLRQELYDPDATEILLTLMQLVWWQELPERDDPAEDEPTTTIAAHRVAMALTIGETDNQRTWTRGSGPMGWPEFVAGACAILHGDPATFLQPLIEVADDAPVATVFVQFSEAEHWYQYLVDPAWGIEEGDVVTVPVGETNHLKGLVQKAALTPKRALKFPYGKLKWVPDPGEKGW